MKNLLFGLIVFSPIFANAYTFDYSKRFGLGASFGYNTPIFGNYLNDQADGKETYSLHGRYHLDSSHGLELSFTRHELKGFNPFKVTDITYFKRFMPLERISPIAGIGLGIVDISNYDPNDLKLGLKLRGGLELAINEDFTLGLNLDYQHVNKMLFAKNLPSRNAHIMALRMGVTWYFGRAETSAIKPLAKKNEPAKPMAPVSPVVIDKSKLDTDGDGVSDLHDKCPNTPAGAKVNAYGCVDKEVAQVTLKVQFELGSTTVNRKYDSDLRELAQFMKDHPKTKIEIQGHTDTTGGAEFNKIVSQKRADSVRDYLVNILKADAARIISVGYGQSVPVQSNSTREGRIANRRVVATISE